MRAVVFRKPYDVAVEEVPDPRIEHPDDVVVRVTSTGICVADLHVYQGRAAAEPGRVLGHENLGIVEDVGSGVTGLEQGDRVVMPFPTACGFCRNCTAGLTGSCLTAAPHPGGQAEYLRVPYADVNCMPLPAGAEHEADYVLLADVFPTGYHGCELAGVAPGGTVAVFGAGPVGLLAAYSALLRGAARVFVVDRVPAWLAAAARIGAVPVDSSEGDPVRQIEDLTGGEGTDSGIDALGLQVDGGPGPRADAAPDRALDQLVQVVRPAGAIGVPGHRTAAAPGRLPLTVDALLGKGLRLGTGQPDVTRYTRLLRDLITHGRARPAFVVSHELPLADAPSAYEGFGQDVEAFTKVLLRPGAA